MRTPVLLLALPALLVACGGTPTKVTGSVAGKSLNAQGAAALTGVTGTGAARQGAVIVIIGEQPSACTNWSGAKFKANQALLLLTVGNRGADAVVPPPGKYTISTSSTASPVAAAAWFATDDKCKPGAPVAAVSGTITLDSVSDGARGSFDLSMLDGSAVTGSFGAEYCVFLARVLSPDSNSTCSP